MKQKLIFFDIDGTIIDHYKKEIPQSTITALKELKNNNHIVAIATGKGPNFIINLFDDIEIDTFIGLNGNYVVYDNEVLYRNYLAGENVKKFTQYCLTNQIAFALAAEEGTKTLYKDDCRIKQYYENFSIGYPKVIDEIDNYNSFLQMTVMLKECQIENVENIRKEFPEFTFVRMSPYGMNVVGHGGLKEKGIQKILNHTTYTSNDLIVFGDGLNDIGMFKLAPISVAMGNAEQHLKDNATHVTDHISNDGIYKACKELNLI